MLAEDVLRTGPPKNTCNFRTEAYNGMLGDHDSNLRSPEATLLRRALLRGAMQNWKAIEVDGVLLSDGLVHPTATLGQLVQGPTPPGHERLMQRLLPASATQPAIARVSDSDDMPRLQPRLYASDEDADGASDGENDPAPASDERQNFKTSFLDPARSYIPTNELVTNLSSPSFDDPRANMPKQPLALFARVPYLASKVPGSDAFKEAIKAVNGDRFRNNQVDAHPFVSLYDLPAGSRPQGRLFSLQLLSAPNRHVFHRTRAGPPGATAYHFRLPLGSWTGTRLQAALQDRLDAEVAPIINGQATHVVHVDWGKCTRSNRYIVGRADHMGSLNAYGHTRAHVLVIDPNRDRIAQTYAQSLHPPVGRAFVGQHALLHPAAIEYFIRVRVGLAPLRFDNLFNALHHKQYTEVDVDFALCHFHRWHSRRVDWSPLGDLAEVWDSRFYPPAFEHDAACLIPINRLAGKFVPGLLDAGELLHEVQDTLMMVLRLPLTM